MKKIKNSLLLYIFLAVSLFSLLVVTKYIMMVDEHQEFIMEITDYNDSLINYAKALAKNGNRNDALLLIKQYIIPSKLWFFNLLDWSKNSFTSGDNDLFYLKYWKINRKFYLLNCKKELHSV